VDGEILQQKRLENYIDYLRVLQFLQYIVYKCRILFWDGSSYVSLVYQFASGVLFILDNIVLYGYLDDELDLL
jgi:hypothetical protein